MDMRSLVTVSLTLLALLALPSAAQADGSASATLAVTATVLPPLPAGATPLAQSQQALSRTVDSWPGYSLSPGPGGEVEAIVLSPDRYRTLTLAPRLVEASAKTNLLMCQGEQRAQSDRHNEAARQWAAELAAAREASRPDWRRVAEWVALGVAIGAVAGGTAVWAAR